MPNDGSKKPGSRYGPKDGREKLLRQGTLLQSRLTRFGGCAWKMSCCGIFCNSQEEGETENKIPHHTSPQRRISGVRHVCFFEVSGSGCYASVHRLSKPERAASLAELIAQQRELSCRTYGYRRMWLWLKHQNIFCNPKTVLQVMKKYDLLSEIRRRRKWQQMGQQVYQYKNLLNRVFQAD